MDDFYQQTPDSIAAAFKTDLKVGLTSEEAKHRLEQDGKNELTAEKKVSPFMKFLLQFKDFLTILLIGAAVISFIFGDIIEGVIIIVILLLNGILGFVQEYQAEQSLEKLKALAGDDTLVIRDGNETRVDVQNIVKGDILVLWEGETIGADVRIFEGSRLKVEEGILTGESVSVNKKIEPITEKNVPLGDMKNMAFMGTTTVGGRGKAIVVRTGMATEMGKIAEATTKTEEEETPLQKNLEKLGKMLGIIVIGVVILVFVAEILIQQGDIIETVETAIALAVSAVPEGLTAAITLTLAIGVQRMAKKKAIIRKLPAVETLGSCQVICSDKTGTLTMNRMTVQRLWTMAKGNIEVQGNGYLPKGNFVYMKSNTVIDIVKESDALDTLKAGYLASTAIIEFSSKKNEWTCEGDPTEGALVVAAMKTPSKIEWEEGYDQKPNGELFFDSERKRMTIVYEDLKSHETWAYMKGSPESVLDKSQYIMNGDKIIKLDASMRATVLEANKTMADKAFRVIGVAKRKMDKPMTEFNIENTEGDMIFIGLEGMIDPPRAEVAVAINKAKKAGIRIIMITGDQKNTALAIAKALDLKPFEDAVYTCYTAAELEAMDESKFIETLKDLDVCARASPSIKARIVDGLQEKYNQVVAMTGDGVNDAPALKSADIGIAMGITGTDVSKEAADMILTDDNFATIVSAIEEGRQIYDNMKSFIRFMLSSNFDEIMLVFVSVVILGLPTPLLALGILWINLLTDGAPALALSVDPGDPNIMNRKPRGKGENMMREILTFALIAGVIAFVATLILYIVYLPADWDADPVGLSHARTIALTVSVIFELSAVFVTRTPDNKSVFQHSPINNRFLIVAILVAFLLHVMIIYVAPLAEVFQLTPLSGADWGWILLTVFIGMVLLDLAKLFVNKQYEKRTKK